MKKLLILLAVVAVACGNGTIYIKRKDPVDGKKNSAKECPAPKNDGTVLTLHVECSGTQSVTGYTYEYSVLRFEDGNEHLHALVGNGSTNINITVEDPRFVTGAVGVDYTYPTEGHTDFSLEMTGCTPTLHMTSNVADDVVTTCVRVYP